MNAFEKQINKVIEQMVSEVTENILADPKLQKLKLRRKVLQKRVREKIKTSLAKEILKTLE